MDSYRPRRPRNPAQTRQRILEAAVAEFSARGFAGGRVDRIARLAGLNKRMLYHYFGDKQGLFDAVLTQAARAGAGFSGRGGAAAADGAAARARVLLWALLEPATAEAARAALAGAGVPAAALAEQDIAELLLRGLWSGTAPAGRKPRIRLKPAPAG